MTMMRTCIWMMRFENNAEEIKDNYMPVTPVVKTPAKEMSNMIEYKSKESNDEPIELIEITHQDLQDILTEFLEEDFNVDEDFELSID